MANEQQKGNQTHPVIERLKDTLAYLFVVGSKPMPFIFAGLVVGLLDEMRQLFTHLEMAIVMTVLGSSGVALVLLPPWMYVMRIAKDRYSDDKPDLWWTASAVGTGALTFWALFVIGVLPTG